MILHKKRINIPSYQVKKGDLIAIKEKSKQSALFKNLKIALKKHKAPKWLELDKEKLEAKVVSLASMDDVNLGKTNEISMVIEFYSR